MPDAFERLFELSKRTGDTLIIFDRDQGNHQVVMSAEKYENLTKRHSPQDRVAYMENDTSLYSEFGSTPAQHNDISEVANSEDNNSHPEQQGNQLSDCDDTNWHSTAEVLDSIQDTVAFSGAIEEGIMPNADFSVDEEVQFRFEDQSTTEEFPISYDPLMEQGHGPEPIPEFQDSLQDEETDEEPLDDEPIFFEEPIA